jgi:hypothetical protein
MTTIYITNNSEKAFKDGFEGKFYEFAVGVPVEVPKEAAVHIFGYGVEDKTPHLARLGWCQSSNDLEESLKIYDLWEFSTEKPQPNHTLSPVVDQVPFPKRGRGKVLTEAA